MGPAFLENINHGRFETWTEKPDMQMLEVKQVHGNDIVSSESLPCEADGIVVLWKDLNKPLLIKTADCLPILIEGEKGAVFLHAGWRGLAHGILKRPEIALINPQRILIGPCIHSCCFEVSSDFEANFKGQNFIKQEEKLYFDLPQEAKRQLREIFPGLLVEIVPICTSCNKAFHSYRRDKTNKRNWNLYIKG